MVMPLRGECPGGKAGLQCDLQLVRVAFQIKRVKEEKMDRRVIVNRKEYESNDYIFALVSAFRSYGWKIIFRGVDKS